MGICFVRRRLPNSQHLSIRNIIVSSSIIRRECNVENWAIPSAAVFTSAFIRYFFSSTPVHCILYWYTVHVDPKLGTFGYFDCFWIFFNASEQGARQCLSTIRRTEISEHYSPGTRAYTPLERIMPFYYSFVRTFSLPPFAHPCFLFY